MQNLNTFCFLFLLFGFFTNCSSAQDKTFTTPPMAPVKQPASAGVNPTTKRFESTEGKFSIAISESPTKTLDQGTQIASKKGVDAGKMFIWQFPEKAFYTISYSTPFDPDGTPLPPVPNELEEAKIGMRKGIARSNGKLISEKSISVKNNPGVEFRYASADGVKYIGRAVIINSIGYQIVGGYLDDQYEKEVLAVLDSFELIPEKN